MCKPKFFYGSLLFYFGVEICTDWLVHSATKLAHAGECRSAIYSYVSTCCSELLRYHCVHRQHSTVLAQNTSCFGAGFLLFCYWVWKAELQQELCSQPCILRRHMPG